MKRKVIAKKHYLKKIPEETSDDKLAKLKKELLEEFCKKYSDIVEFLKKMPAHKMKEHGIMNFDQGFLWIREMILNQLQLPENSPNLNPPFPT